MGAKAAGHSKVDFAMPPGHDSCLERDPPSRSVTNSSQPPKILHRLSMTNLIFPSNLCKKPREEERREKRSKESNVSIGRISIQLGPGAINLEGPMGAHGLFDEVRGGKREDATRARSVSLGCYEAAVISRDRPDTCWNSSTDQ
ncbi:hypothetical protein KM043_003611 [Ampulex compressa]|nr:hypothetical protein KM043_003611 [Ampulex compressa]